MVSKKPSNSKIKNYTPTLQAGAYYSSSKSQKEIKATILDLDFHREWVRIPT